MIPTLFGSLFALMSMGMYVFAALGLSAALILLLRGDVPLTVLTQTMVGGIDSPALVAIPMYILVGEVMTLSGITDRLVAFSRLFVGQVRGGLAYVAVMANLFSSGVSGSAVADASATGSALLPAMKKAGYRDDFSAALIGAAAAGGVAIPPSIPMIFIALVTDLSIGKLFLGGIVPGLLMGAALAAALWFMMRKGDFPAGEPVDRSLRAVTVSFKDAFFALLAPAIIVIGIVGGLVTIVEASVLAAAYVLFVGVVIYRTITWRDLPGLFRRTAVFSSTLLIIFAAIGPFQWIMARGQVAQRIGDLIDSLDLGPAAFMLFVIILMLILGMVMDGLPIILLLVPILIPVGTELGLDPTHLGIVIVLTLGMGLVTPPMGALLFVMARLSGVPFHKLVKASLPFLGALTVALLLIAYVDELVLAIPRMVFGP